MRLLRSLFPSISPAPVAAPPDLLRARRDMLAEAALALTQAWTDSGMDAVLHVTADAAARITGAAAALVVIGGDGRVERFAGHDVDRCTRDTLARPDLLATVVGRLRELGRPLGPDDLERPVARTLEAIAPHGLVVVPAGAGAILVLVQRGPDPEDAIDQDAVGVVLILARVAAASLAGARGVAATRTTCDELRRLNGQVLVRQDEELARAAHALHEGVCQRLAAANAQLEALAAQLDGQRGALARLRDARALVNETVGELRELAQRMRPSVLENLGYVEALRWYLKRLRDRSGVALSLEVEGAETRLPVAMESALFRATEEALGPAADAHASQRLRVRYRRGPEAVRLEIVGSPPEAVDLVAIRERLRPFGGAVRVTSAPDSPVIQVEVPARMVN